MKKMIIVSVALLTLSFGSFARADNCNYGGLQEALRNGADSLHRGNPVKYIDFSNDAYFSYALDEMKAVGVSNARVEAAWVQEIKAICGPKAARLRSSDVGPSQNLSGLMHLLGISQ